MIRQLTAIMFTDMVGYTALMQEDERQAMHNRDFQREVLERLISENGGRILQFYGDGTLSVFQSAVAAVETGIRVQEALRRSDRAVPLRIGIHSGDVVHDDNGVFGDGVNVASRIEGLGVPGSVLISGKVYDEVKNQPDIRTKGLGSFNLKNIKHPMRVYAIANRGLEIPPESAVSSGRAARSRSVAVLPFVNMSSDPENEFFSDGITEEIINALTRVNGLKVTARTSSFAFKNPNEDIREIAKALDVTHVLEGSVRKVGNQVRISAQLISASDGYHLMSEVYDGTLDDIFALQDEISRRIVDQLADHLGPVPVSKEAAGEAGLVPVRSPDSHAYAEYLRGRFAWGKWSPEGARNAMAHYHRAIEMDPEFALPFSGLAASNIFLAVTGHVSTVDAFEQAEAAAMRAIELDDSAGEAHSAMGMVRLFRRRDWQGAYRSFQRALSLTPGSAEVHHLYGMYLHVVGDLEPALEELRAAIQLDPLSPSIRLNYADALLAAGDLDAAQAELEAILTDDPTFRAATELLGWVKLLRDDMDGALELFGSLPVMAGHPYAAAGVRGLAFAMAGRRDDALEMLTLLERRKRDDPEVALSVDFAFVHQGLGDFDRVFDYLEQAVDEQAGMMVFLRANPRWSDRLRADERFDALLERTGQP